MRPRRDEDGSILPMTALTVVIVLVIAAFAVDLGIQRAASSDMQAVADSVAIDTARALPTCSATTLTTRANQSLARQGRSLGTSSPLRVTPGFMDPVTQRFRAATAGASGCDAVQITAATTVDFAFAPVIGRSNGQASRDAVGSMDTPAICFSAGTKSLVLNTSGGALGPILDYVLRVNLSVVGYEGIVDLKNLSIPLADLKTALNVGSVQQLASTTVTLRDFLVASATVLRKQSSAAALAQATLLETISAKVGAVTVDLGKILAVDTAGDAALKANVNALDLIGTAIVAANGTKGIAVNDLNITLPADLLKAKSSISIIEPPRIACGKSGVMASTAQVRLDLESGVNVLGLLQAADVSLGVRVGSGTATLGAMSCNANAGNPTAAVSAQTSAADVVGVGGTGSARLNVVSLLGLIRLGVDLKGSVASSTASSYTFLYPAATPAPGLPPTHQFGSPVNLTLEVANTGLLGTLLSPVTTILTKVLNPALNALLNPVLNLLGIKLGTMDVTMLGRPVCNAVRLAQ